MLDRWPYSRSQVSPNIAVCTPAFLANFIRGPNILEEELFRSLRQLVLDEVSIVTGGRDRSMSNYCITADPGSALQNYPLRRIQLCVQF